MKLIVEKGDLFDLDSTYALVHCISLDCAMGAGIAVEFDKRFPDMKGDLLRTIGWNDGNNPFTIEHHENDRRIYNLITKEKYWHKPTYQSFEKSLEKLVELCVDSNVNHLAMPKIGCGLDRLKWNMVKEMIIEAFGNTDIEIVVRYL